MAVKYIIRMDDACPVMDYKKWDRLENILDKHGVRPLIAVIPKNEDPRLIRQDEDPHFWSKVKKWKEKGWEIAQHGYNHVYHLNRKSIIPFKKKSEFSGLPFDEQCAKIDKGFRIFSEHGIEPRVFIAPGHAFDKTTIAAIKKTTNFDIVSDGYFLKPVNYLNINWIPQQLGRPRKMPWGLWTICLHPNNMNEAQFDDVEMFLERHRNDVIEVCDVKIFNKINILNKVFSILFYFLIFLKITTFSND